jgi:hypothetical protein
VKLKFFYDEFGIPAVETSARYEVIGYVLTDNAYPEACDTLIEKVKEAKGHSGFVWEMSFNKSIVNISDNYVQCLFLYDEERAYKMKLDGFDRLINSWRSFLSKKGAHRSSVYIDK